MNWLWRQSHAIGFVPSLLCAIGWVGCGAAVARAGASALSRQYPAVGMLFVIVMIILVAAGGLVSFWILADHIDFRMGGYQIRCLTGNKWVYEERRADGSIECLPFFRKTVGDGYPAPCEVHIASEENWYRQAPQWAQGRRAEILGRIADQSGANAGGHVSFCDSA